MRRRDIVVVGASAGGVEALSRFVSGLPDGFGGSVFVVLHVPAYSESALPRILERAGPLPAAHAREHEPILPGRIYVAPPDRHLVVLPGEVRVTRGPRENRLRPSVDVLFRTAARSYGPRVVGIVLSGALDDGSAGLLAIKQRGGLAAVQTPDEASMPSMPESALARVRVDYCLPARALAGAVADLALADRTMRGWQDEPEGGVPVEAEEHLEVEADMAELRAEAVHQSERPGTSSVFGCPDCGGVLWQIEDQDLLRFRCRVGHAYTAEGLLDHMSESLEDALWVALRALEEKVDLATRLAHRSRGGGRDRGAQKFEESAADARRHAESIRRLLLRNGSPEQPLLPSEEAAA